MSMLLVNVRLDVNLKLTLTLYLIKKKKNIH